MSSSLRLLRHGAPPLELEQPRTLLGRDATCDVVLDDKSVSRRHAYVERRGSSWYVLDQGSANGTFVNGQQIAEAELRHGQEVRFGTMSLWVELPEEDAPQTMMMGGEPATTMMPAPPAAAPAAPAWGGAPAAGYGGGSGGYAAGGGGGYAPAPDYGGGYGGGYAPQPAAPAYSPQSQAAALLGVTQGASAQEVAARYREVSSDLQAKIGTAPNAHLRSTYQQNLDEARRAYEMLVGSPPPGGGAAAGGAAPSGGMGSGPYAADAHLDLPAAQPAMVEEHFEAAIEDAPKVVGQAREAVASRVAGPSPVTTGVGIGIVLLMGVTTYFCLGAGKLQKNIATIEKASDTMKVRTEWALVQPIDKLEKEGALKNGKLSICNKSSQPVDFAWFGVVYIEPPPNPELNPTPIVKSYNSLLCRNEFKLQVPPGAQEPVAFKSDNDKCRWNGEGLYYAFRVKKPVSAAPPPPKRGKGQPAPPPEQPFAYYSGLLNNRTDCVTIGEGW